MKANSINGNTIERLQNLDENVIHSINNYFPIAEKTTVEETETKNYFIGDGSII